MRRTSTAGRRPARLSSAPGPALERLEAGIDEAGFGPLLGPLCLGYAAFDRPPDGTDLWSLLRPAVAPTPSSDDLPAVCDSKVLYPGEGGFARLERTALLFLSLVRGGRPGTIRGLIGGPFAPAREALERHPWYRDLDLPLPRRVAVEVLKGDLDRAREACDRAGVRVREAGVRVVPEAAFNEGVARHDNKAAFHLDLVADLLRLLATLPRRGAGTILIDRLKNDSSMDVKMAAVVALGQFGGESRAALPDLRELGKKFDAKKSKEGQTIMTTIQLINMSKKKKA